MVEITDVYEGKRGCGYRKKGGIYLRTGKGLGRPCGKFPIEMKICPCCNQGIKPARGWTWVDGDLLVKNITCKYEGNHICSDCPINSEIGRAGLIWIGGKFYKKWEEWSREADLMGVSRRISQVPRDFKLGETWVFVGHRERLSKKCNTCGDVLSFQSREHAEIARKNCKDCKGKGIIYSPALFQIFKPEKLEYVVKETETKEELERLKSRGFDLVRVHQLTKQIKMEL